MLSMPSITEYLLMFNEIEDGNVKQFLEFLNNAVPYTTPYVYPIALTAQTASVYLTVTVTFER